MASKFSYNDQNIQPGILWEKSNALMMDVMTKNLGIEDTVSNALSSFHKPHHLSSKSHTVDVND